MGHLMVIFLSLQYSLPPLFSFFVGTVVWELCIMGKYARKHVQTLRSCVCCCCWPTFLSSFVLVHTGENNHMLITHSCHDFIRLSNHVHVQLCMCMRNRHIIDTSSCPFNSITQTTFMPFKIKDMVSITQLLLCDHSANINRFEYMCVSVCEVL